MPKVIIGHVKKIEQVLSLSFKNKEIWYDKSIDKKWREDHERNKMS